MGFIKRIHLPALGGLITSLLGLVDLAAKPEVAPVLPHFMPDAWATALVAIGVAVQAVTRAIHDKPAA